MTINDTRTQFATWLDLASFRAVKFAQEFVSQNLEYSFQYEVHLSCSHDEIEEDFECYPEDAGRELQCRTQEEAVELLVRNCRIPVWIDIAAYKFSKEYTVLLLTCAGRFTNDTGKLYYYDRGIGCFGVKSPSLPSGYRDGKKFKLKKA